MKNSLWQSHRRNQCLSSFWRGRGPLAKGYTPIYLLPYAAAAGESRGGKKAGLRSLEENEGPKHVTKSKPPTKQSNNHYMCMSEFWCGAPTPVRSDETKQKIRRPRHVKSGSVFHVHIPYLRSLRPPALVSSRNGRGTGGDLRWQTHKKRQPCSSTTLSRASRGPTLHSVAHCYAPWLDPDFPELTSKALNLAWKGNLLPRQKVIFRKSEGSFSAFCAYSFCFCAH